MAKRSSDPRVAYPEVKVQVRDLVRVVGIVAHFGPTGLSIQGNSSYRTPGGICAQETCAGCPKQRYATGEPCKVQGRDRVGIVERTHVYLARGVSVRGKFILTRNPGYKTSGVAMWLNVHSSDPRVAYPKVKVQVWDLVRVVGILAPLAPRGVSIRENSFYRAPGGKWAQETCAGCPQQRYAMGEPGKVQGWDRVGIVEWFCGNWAQGVSIRGKFVLSIRLGYKTSHHVAKHSSEPRVAYPEVKVQVRDRVRVVRIVSPFAPRGVSIQGKFVLSSPRG